MIALDKIKVLFLDYDDTVCIHIYDKRERNHEGWLKALYTGDDTYYLNTERFAVQSDVKAFASLCHMTGIVVNCLSWGSNNSPYRAKKKFLDTNLPGIVDELYISGSREGKLQVIKDYCSCMDIKLDEVLMIDDHPQTQHELNEAGIMTLSPIVLTTDLSKVFDLTKL